MINLEILQAQVKAKDERIDKLLDTIHDMSVQHQQYFDQAEASLRSNQDLIFAMFEKFGPKIDIVIPKFSEHMANAQILGGMGIDADGTLTVGIEFSLTGFPETETTTQPIDE